MTIPTSVIDQAEVTDVMASHPRTYMRDMTLNITANPPFLQKLRAQWGITTDGAINLDLRANSKKEYDIKIKFLTPQEGEPSPKVIDHFSTVIFK